MAMSGLLGACCCGVQAPAPTGGEAAPETARQGFPSGARTGAEWDCAGRLDVDALSRRARLADAEAQYMLARTYRMGRDAPQDDELAVLWYRRAAEQGHAGAQAMLGRMYFFAQGLPRDVAAAATWYRRAAEQGHAMAQFWLGDMHSSGNAPQDQAIAATWYRRAAEQGHAMAQWGLGRVYAQGRGVPQDDVEAVAWYALAATGLPGARSSYEDAVARLDPAAAAEARRRALAFQPVVEMDPGCVP